MKTSSEYSLQDDVEDVTPKAPSANRFNFRMWDKSRGQMGFQQYYCHAYIESPDPDVIVMQSTGLVDKCGKEIYEGDIYSFKNQWMSKAENWVVSWCDLRACFLLDGLPFPDQCDEGIHLEDRCEIIGNIYENPELVRR